MRVSGMHGGPLNYSLSFCTVIDCPWLSCSLGIYVSVILLSYLLSFSVKMTDVSSAR